MPIDTTHIDPDVAGPLVDLDNRLGALAARVTALESVPLLPPNQPPVWATVPTISFQIGVASSISIAGFVSDAEALTITKNSAVLPAGVTFDSPGKRFLYDGAGAASNTAGHVLTADDGMA